MSEVLAFMKEYGFPAVICIIVLLRVEPALRKLDNSITTLMVVTARSNGMKSKTVEEIVARVMSKRTGKRRRATDVLHDTEEIGEDGLPTEHE